MDGESSNMSKHIEDSSGGGEMSSDQQEKGTMLDQCVQGGKNSPEYNDKDDAGTEETKETKPNDTAVRVDLLTGDGLEGGNGDSGMCISDGDSLHKTQSETKSPGHVEPIFCSLVDYSSDSLDSEKSVGSPVPEKNHPAHSSDQVIDTMGDVQNAAPLNVFLEPVKCSENFASIEEPEVGGDTVTMTSSPQSVEQHSPQSEEDQQKERTDSDQTANPLNMNINTEIVDIVAENVSDSFVPNSNTFQLCSKESSSSVVDQEVCYVLLEPDGTVATPDISKVMDYRDEASDADSERSDTSCSSSSIGDSSSDEKEIFQVFSGASSEDDGNQHPEKFSKKNHKDMPRTKGEFSIYDLPLIEDLAITVDENVEMVEVGIVLNLVDTLVIVQAKNDLPPLNMDTILFLDERKVLGQIFETFGPVSLPLYSVRYNTREQIDDRGIEAGQVVYYAPKAPEFTHYVFMEHLKEIKGSDASWEHNNEPPRQFLDYSDDEQERKAKSDRAKEKRKEREKNGLEPKGKRTNKKDFGKGRGKNINTWPPESHSQLPSRPSMGVELNHLNRQYSWNRDYGHQGSLHAGRQENHRDRGQGMWNRGPASQQLSQGTGSVGVSDQFQNNDLYQDPAQRPFPSWPPSQNNVPPFDQYRTAMRPPFQPCMQQRGNNANCHQPPNFGQHPPSNEPRWGASSTNQRPVFGKHNMPPVPFTNQRPDHMLDTRYMQCPQGPDTNNRGVPPRYLQPSSHHGQYHNNQTSQGQFGSFSNVGSTQAPMQPQGQHSFGCPRMDYSGPSPNLAPPNNNLQPSFSCPGPAPPNNNVPPPLFNSAVPPPGHPFPNRVPSPGSTSSINNSPLALYPTSDWGHVG